MSNPKFSGEGALRSDDPKSAATFVRQHKNGAKAKKDNKSKITEKLDKTRKIVLAIKQTKSIK